MEITKFKISELNPAKYNPRKEFKPGEMCVDFIVFFLSDETTD